MLSIQGSSNVIIGGVGLNQANTIAFNASGVLVTGAANFGVSIRGNSIHSNTALGIDLQFDGVTLNDSLDADTGPNGFQNFPDITNVGANSVSGTFNGAPGTTLTLDFYSSPAPGASGFGQGRVYLGAQIITTNAAGFAPEDAARIAAIPPPDGPVDATLRVGYPHRAYPGEGRTLCFATCEFDRIFPDALYRGPDGAPDPATIFVTPSNHSRRGLINSGLAADKVLLHESEEERLNRPGAKKRQKER